MLARFQEVQRGWDGFVPYYQGKTIVVAGTDHPLVGVFVQLLAQLEAIVVLVGCDADRLTKIAEFAPQRIETLTLNVSNEEQVTRFVQAWGREPLHLLAYFYPTLAHTASFQTTSSMIRLIEGLSPGLRAADGSAIVVTDPIPDSEGYDMAARHGALSKLVPRLSAGLGTRILGLILPTIADHSTSDGVIDAMLMAGLPQNKMLNGMVLPLLPAARDD